ncbi:MAG: hemerythrin family protein [Candidatus Heimdallarchaeota archaeon]|nr:hemerythrin family protein [Candidatus Heimdallarchaeota archaeon]
MVKWSDKLKIGIDLIDAQHKTLIDTLNSLVEKSDSGSGLEEIQNMLIFLVEYITVHFRDEEKIMEEYNFPEIKKHKKIHESFENKVGEMVLQYSSGGKTAELLKRIKNETIKWLINHIGVRDQELADYIKSKKLSSE